MHTFLKQNVVCKDVVHFTGSVYNLFLFFFALTKVQHVLKCLYQFLIVFSPAMILNKYL